MNRPKTDPRHLTFSQAQGLEPLPRPLALGELPQMARNRLWDVFYRATEEHSDTSPGSPYLVVYGPWKEVLRDLYVKFFNEPTDGFSRFLDNIRDQYKDFMLGKTQYNKVFDLIQFIMRHPGCPPDFTSGIMAAFEECSMAYVVDTNDPPTIFPAATPEEGEAILKAREDLRTAALHAANGHLQRAAELMNGGKWRESAHESISAVESVGLSLGVRGSTLAAVLKRLRSNPAWRIHPAFLAALDKLYAYTSDEQGVRHAAVDDQEHVGREEAQFMMGVCAASCSYLLGKQRHAVEADGRRAGNNP